LMRKFEPSVSGSNSDVYIFVFLMRKNCLAPPSLI
jgi:hypothetical protein